MRRLPNTAIEPVVSACIVVSVGKLLSRNSEVLGGIAAIVLFAEVENLVFRDIVRADVLFLSERFVGLFDGPRFEIVSNPTMSDLSSLFLSRL